MRKRALLLGVTTSVDPRVIASRYSPNIVSFRIPPSTKSHYGAFGNYRTFYLLDISPKNLNGYGQVIAILADSSELLRAEERRIRTSLESLAASLHHLTEEETAEVKFRFHRLTVLRNSITI